MELMAGDLSDGDVLVDYGPVSDVVRYTDVETQEEITMMRAGDGVLIFMSIEYFRVTA